MKKSICRVVMISLAAISLFSCKEDYSSISYYEDCGSEVIINGKINQCSQTRVSDLGFTDKDAIGVYLVDYVNGEPGKILAQGNHATNVKFVYDESSNSWKGSSKLYWMDNVTPLDGYSYYPFRELVSNPQAMEFSVQTRQDLQEDGQVINNYERSDFLWAKSEKVVPGQVINLNHNHLMAGVEINLIPGIGFDNTTWTELEKSVIIEQVKTKSIIDLSTGHVVADGGELLSVVPYDKGGTYRAVLVPQTKAAGETLFSITVDGTSYQFKRESDMVYFSQKLHKFTIEVVQRLPEGDYDFNLIDEAITAWEDDGISHTGTIIEYIVMQSPEKGGLRSVLESSGYDLNQLENLKVIGEMNADDFTAVRELLPALKAINLQDVQLKIDGAVEQKVIPWQAFWGCSNLEYFVFPKEIEGIQASAFAYSGLRGALNIPEGVKFIGEYAFDNGDDIVGMQMYLTSLTLPSTLESIGQYAFSYNKFNNELILPEKLKEIGEGAFYECPYISGYLNFPSQLTNLGYRAFSGSEKLNGPLVIPSGIKEIRGLCRNGFSSVSLPDGLEIIGENALGGIGYGDQFEVYESKIQGDLYVPKTVRKIEKGAFAGLQISHVNLPEGITEIPRDLFRGCDKLQDTLKIPTTVRQIRSGAFEGCSNLTAIILPESLESIGGDNSEYSWMQFSTFGGCYSLSLLRCDAKAPPLIIGDVFGDLPKNNFSVQVPAGSVEAYRNADGWKEFKRITPYSNFVCRPQFANLLNKGHKYDVILNADGAWKVKEIPSWCHISASSGLKKTELTITIDDLADGAGFREDSIVFSLEGTDHTTCYYIKQYDSEYKEDNEHVLQTAKCGKGINVILLGDGYAAKDIVEGKYLMDMQQTMDYFFGIEPFTTYRDFFNVSTVWALSCESGIGTLTTLRDTKFDTQYGNFVHDSRIHCEADYVMQYVVDNTTLTAQTLANTLVILVPNSDIYDGLTYMYDDGSALAICPKSSLDFPYDARGIIQHEACGHGFTKLADEYMYHKSWIQICACTCCEHIDGLVQFQSMGWGLNLSLTGKYKEVPWYHLIHDARFNDIVDIYEGGYFHTNGVYRSEYNSVMNNNVPYLSTWGRELAVRRIKMLAGESFNYEDFVANDSREWGDESIATRNQMAFPDWEILHGAAPVIINRSPNLNIK